MQKNKKSQSGVIWFLICVVVIIAIMYIWFLIFHNHGTSTDYAYSVEKSNVGWNKLWLKDDHTTVYCFDQDNFLEIIKKAQNENKKVKVTYQDYFIRGFFCSSGNDKIGETIITNIEVIE
jgi:uncharacterized protein (UPF0333 family)